MRSALALSDGERVEVEIGGRIAAERARTPRQCSPHGVQLPERAGNADLTMLVEGLHGVGDSWGRTGSPGPRPVSAAQAHGALHLPTEAQGRMRVGFSGADMVISPSAPGGLAMSAAVTPQFERTAVSVGLTSVTIGDKTSPR